MRTYIPKKLKGTIKTKPFSKSPLPSKSYSDAWVFTGELPYLCTKKYRDSQ